MALPFDPDSDSDPDPELYSSPNVPAQARRANGVRIEPRGSTGVALQRACSAWFYA